MTAAAPAQAGLFGATGAAPAHRLFFALRPQDEEIHAVQARAAALQASHPGTRWLRPARYHLTLLYLGESAGRREDWIAQARSAAREVRGAAFDLVLDRLQALGNPRNPALALVGNAPPALQALHQDLRQRLLRAGFARLSAQLLPHLTLGYARPHPALVPVTPLRLRPAGFCLLLGVDGQADYECLGEWPFAA